MNIFTRMSVINVKFFPLCAVFALLLTTVVFAGRTAPDDVKPAALLNKAELSISAQVYQDDQDQIRQPLEADFYLLDQSIVEILKKSRFTPVEEGTGGDPENVRMPDESAYLEALAGILESDGDDAAILNPLFWNAVEKRRISGVISTNLFGNASSKTVRSGNYYLFGYAALDDRILIWNVPVRLRGGKNTLELDQYNAEIF